MSFDVIADLFCSLNNASIIGKQTVVLPHSKIKVNILELLKSECIVADFKIEEQDKKKKLIIFLSYHKGLPTFKKISRVSKQSLRVYKGCDKIGTVRSNRGFYIVSTSKYGIISGSDAYIKKVGGEIIGKVI